MVIDDMCSEAHARRQSACTVVEGAIDEVLAVFDNDRAFMVEKIDTHFDEGDDAFIRIEIIHVHIGTLGLPERNTISRRLAIEDCDNAKGIVLDTVRSIRASLDDQVDFDSIGHAIHMVDHVLARLLTTDPRTAIAFINRSVISDDSDGDTLVDDQVYKHVDFGDPEARLEICMTLGPGILWRPDLAAIEFTDLPDIVQSALAGRPISDLVTHPLLPTDLLIDRVETIDEAVFVHFIPEHIPLADILGQWPRAEGDPSGISELRWLDGTPIEFHSI